MEEEIWLEDLLGKMGKAESLFKLCNMAAARATELNSGMRNLVDVEPNEKKTTIAIREIANGKVKIKKGK